MSSSSRHGLLLIALAACTTASAPEPPLSQENSAARAHPTAAAPVEPAAEPAPTTSSGVDPRLPVVGDPLGLLSKPSAQARAPAAKADANRLDPGALMADIPLTAPSEVALDRDPRAVARGHSAESTRSHAGGARPSGGVQVLEKSAREVVRRASQGGARAHVLLLYAAYCKACRGVMPKFVELARQYKGKGVAFTVASVDRDPEAFAAYASVLQGTLEPFWIRSDGTTQAELKRAGIQLPGDSFYIPLFAVFAGQNRLVAQGNTSELRDLPRTLDALL